MLVKSLFLSCFILMSCSAIGQQSKTLVPENRFSLSFGPQYNFNKSGVRNDPAGPKTISASNAVGGYIGLGYERKTRKGLVFSYDLQLRMQPQEVFVDYDIETFDPRGSIALRDLGSFNRRFNTTFHMLDNRFMAGYEHPIGNPKNGLFLQEKIGVTLSHLFSGTIGSTGEKATAIYPDDNDPGTIYRYPFIYVVNNFDGRIPNQTPAHKALLTGYSVNLYVGFVQKVDRPWLKSVSFGLEGRFSGLSGPADVYVETTSSFNGGPGLQTDNYSSTYRSIGLHMALNFWK